MNKNEFYKELMTRYALDEEKIRLNALKQAKKPAWQRFAADYWKPALGTAAAIAVTAAAVGYTSSYPFEPPVVIPEDTALSASQRLWEAEQNYYNLQAAAALSDIYVTFSEPISYGELVVALSTVSDTGEVMVDALYTEDQAVFREEALREYEAAHDRDKTVIGAKISAPSALYRDIQDLSKVYLAEFGSAEINDDTFIPLPIEDPDPLGNDPNDTEIPVTQTTEPITTTPFSFDTSSETTSATKWPEIGESGTDGVNAADTTTETEAPDPIVTTTEAKTPEPAVTTTEAKVPEPIDTATETKAPEPIVPATETKAPKPVVTDGELDDPEETEPDETEPEYDDPDETERTFETTAETPANEITSAVTEPGQPLLTEFYELNVPNSLETYLSGDNAVVLTKSAAYLYSFGGFGGSQCCAAIELGSPKIGYSDEHKVIVTGCNSSDVRNIISVIDLDRNEAKTYDVSANIGEAGLGGILYAPFANKYYVKSVLDTTSFVYEVTVSTSAGLQFRPLLESDGPISVAGVKDGLLYLAKAKQLTSGTKLFSFDLLDGTLVELADFDSTVKLRRGSDRESFGLISESGSFIYDVNLGMLVSGVVIDENTEILSDSGRTCFQSGGIVYEIDSHSLVNRAERTVIFPEKAGSDFAVNEITSEKVVVTRKDSASWTQ